MSRSLPPGIATLVGTRSSKRGRPRAADLYENDFYAWTLQQASFLRDLAGVLATSGGEAGHFAEDFHLLAEEIEDVGKAERNACRSQTRRIIEHLLKLEYSPAVRPRRNWRTSVIGARIELPDHLTPTLRRELEQRLEILYAEAARKASSALAARREDARAQPIPTTCPYTLDQILDIDWYPVNRHGLVDDPA